MVLKSPDKIRKGIILAGGNGSRLYPLTKAISKQLLPIHDKPMIYYPLTTLMLGGLRQILIITTPHDRHSFETLLGDGSQWGLQLAYAEQPDPGGLAQALLIAESFLDGAPSALILGDNLFFGAGLPELLGRVNARHDGATIFAHPVSDPERYGIIAFDAKNKPVALDEKPKNPRSTFAALGLYFYDRHAPRLAATLQPSERGELEITDLNRHYLNQGALTVERIGRGYTWIDAGTPKSLLDAHIFVSVIEQRQGFKIACPEEIAYHQGWIGIEQFKAHVEASKASDYGDYLSKLLTQMQG